MTLVDKSLVTQDFCITERFPGMAVGSNKWFAALYIYSPIMERNTGLASQFTVRLFC
jgi:hypothetical protein